MATVMKFYDLDVWKDAHQLCIEIYKLTGTFPKTETYAIVDQMRRAASSVGANIAEGFGRYHYKDKIKFYYHSRGSACEVQNFLLLSKDLDYLGDAKTKELIEKYENLNKRINSFIKSVSEKMTNDR
jgi:four helix bundle protein